MGRPQERVTFLSFFFFPPILLGDAFFIFILLGDAFYFIGRCSDLRRESLFFLFFFFSILLGDAFQRLHHSNASLIQINWGQDLSKLVKRWNYCILFK